MERYIIPDSIQEKFQAKYDQLAQGLEEFRQRTHNPSAKLIDYYAVLYEKFKEDVFLATGKRTPPREDIMQFYNENLFLYKIAHLPSDPATLEEIDVDVFQTFTPGKTFRQLKNAGMLGESVKNTKLYDHLAQDSAHHRYQLFIYDPFERKSYEIQQTLTISPKYRKILSFIAHMDDSIDVTNPNDPAIKALANLYLRSDQVVDNIIFHIDGIRVESGAQGRFRGELTFKNGRLDTDTMEFKPFDPDGFRLDMPNTIQVHYPDKELNIREKQLFRSFFSTLAGNESTKALRLKQLCVAGLLKLTHLKKAYVIYGPAGTGKSTFLAILDALTTGNDHTKRANMTFAEFDYDDAVITAKDKFLILGTDNADKTRMTAKGVNNFKRMVQHDEVGCFVKYGDREFFTFAGLIVQATNDLPSFDYAASAEPITDRLVAIELNNRLRNTANQQTNITNVLLSDENLPKLIRYLLEEIEYFKDLATHKDDDLITEVIAESDSVTEFMKYLDESGLGLCEHIPFTFLHASYLAWHKRTRSYERPIGVKVFNKRIKSLLKQMGVNIDNQIRMRFNSLESNYICDFSIFTSISSPDLQELIKLYKDENKLITCFEYNHSVIRYVEDTKDRLLRQERLIRLSKIVAAQTRDMHLLALTETFDHLDELDDEQEKMLKSSMMKLYTKRYESSKN
jgi:hypothetical protein